jgi:hypothetical protein
MYVLLAEMRYWRVSDRPEELSELDFAIASEVLREMKLRYTR